MSKMQAGMASLTPLQRAAFAMKQMRVQLDTIKQKQNEAIAIVGMGCRFPGGANNPEAFWQLLANGVDAVAEIPKGRWDVDAYYDPDPDAAGKMYVRHGAFLDEVDQFDPQFFGISGREAVSLDPQQRLLLEVTWEALEHAGQAPNQLIGSRTGAFIGIGQNDYAQLQLNSGDHERIDTYSATGNGLCFASGRLSYTLGLQGPTLAVDTACSSSLVAIHLACQSLRTGECDLALAGGVQLILSPELTISLSRMRALAPDGRCKTFDASADGYGRGEGCGVIVLKRLSDAQANGDNILAVIRGSAINHDGASSGLTVPNKLAQEALIRRALKNAQAEPEEVSYIDAHGTGTSLGDPLEVRALGSVMKGRETPLLIGSVKSNIGHLEAAAGIAGIIKVVLAMQNGEIPAHLHFKNPNPHLNWDQLPVKVPTERMAWPNGTPLAGVSSFGLSGTNAHVVLAASPVDEKQDISGQASLTDITPQHVLTLSAKTETGLKELAAQYETHFSAHPDLNWAKVCLTANTGRAHFKHRLSVIADSLSAAQEKLVAFVTGEESIGLTQGQVAHQPNVVFLFTGQGAQYVGMGRELYETEAIFRQTIDRCDEIWRSRPYLDQSLLSVLYGPQGEADELIHSTAYTQPALFALEYALAELWKSWGITPDIVMGHSVGEYVAACVAGVFSLEEGLTLIAERGRLMQALPQGGEMVALFATPERVADAIKPHIDEISIAAINGPESVVISGTRQVVLDVAEQLAAEEIKSKVLTVSHAFHSPLMEPMLADFARVAGGVTYSSPKIKLISNLTGDIAGQEIMTPDYWGRHIRQPVEFYASMATLDQLGGELFVEIGPSPTLLGMARRCLPNHNGAWLPSLRPGHAEPQRMLTTLAELYVRGAEVDWATLSFSTSGNSKENPLQRVILPTYPFQRQRYWVDVAQKSRLNGKNGHSAPTLHPLLGQALHLANSEELRFESYITSDTLKWPEHHRVFDDAVLPATAYLEIGLAAAQDALQAPVVIEDVVIQKTMRLPDDAGVTAQIVVVPNGAECAWQIFSQSGEQSDSAPTWTLHASGKALAKNGITVEQVNLASLRARCQEEVNVEAHYQSFLQQGLDYGPRFQAIEQLWRGNDEALGLIQLPTELLSSADEYQLHPVLLDAALQAAAASSDDGQDSAYLPVGIDRYTLFGSPSGPDSQLWSYAQVRHSTPESKTVDISLFDEGGNLVARLHGLQWRRVSREALLRSMRKNDWLHDVQWEAKPIQNATSAHVAGSWLILADEGGIGEQLANLLTSHGAHCVMVSQTKVENEGQLDSSLDYVEINASRPAEYDRLIARLHGIDMPAGSTEQPFRGAIHLWSLDEAELPTPPTLAYGSALHLAQTLVQHGMDAPLWLVTQNTQPVDESPLQVQQAPLWGLGRVMALEHPELQPVLVDLPTDEQLPLAKMLFDELQQRVPSSQGAEDQVAYRDDTRYVARLTRFEPEAMVPVEELLRSDSSYLITGGFGVLGIQAARFLLEQGACHLVLTSRRGSDSKSAQEAIRSLEKAGAQVQVIQADVSKPEDVRTLLQAIEQPLRGIVHAAGVLDDGLLIQQSVERFERVLAPKVMGAWHLHTLTEEMPLDFFVCFSSVASILGSVGQSNYAAANAFMDALAHHRHRLGLPALSINWGPWAVGMAADVKYRQGVNKITAQKGLSVFGELLGQSAPQLSVIPANWPKFIKSLPEVPPFISNLVRQKPVLKAGATGNLLSRLKNTSEDERQTLIKQYSRQIVSQIMGINPPFDVDQPLTELGIDSLMSVELRNRIENDLKVIIPMRKMMEGASTHVLAKLIEAKIESASSSTHYAKTKEEQDSEFLSLVQVGEQIPQLLAVVTKQVGRDILADGEWRADFASCNYLGVDLHPKVMEAIPAALREWGVHPSWARSVASPSIYNDLEEELANLVEAPTTLVFPAVTLLHIGVIPVLAGSDGVIFKDSEAHESIYEGCRLAQAGGAEFLEFRHNDMAELEEKLARYPKDRTKIIAVDGVYSMSGGYPPLLELVPLAKKYNATLYVDDAHGVGVIGKNPDAEMPYGYGGSGIVTHLGLDYIQDNIIYVAGLSKAFSSYGAFITCHDENMKIRFTTASTFVFSGPSPVASLASALAGLRLNRVEGDGWREQIYRLTHRLVTGAQAIGFEVENDNFFPVVAVIVGNTTQVIEACNIMWEYGILITPAFFPVVPMSRGRLRFSVTAANTIEQVDQALRGLEAVWNKQKLVA